MQSSSMSFGEAVIGASDHYARAELITLAVENAVPVFLDRRRVELIDKDLPSTPYHHEALELDIEAAIDLVKPGDGRWRNTRARRCRPCGRAVAPRY